MTFFLTNLSKVVNEIIVNSQTTTPPTVNSVVSQLETSNWGIYNTYYNSINGIN